MRASLPMYDLPEIRAETDRLWQALAERLGVQTPMLRGDDYTAAWRDPDLTFSQTCGFPFTHGFRGKLRYVATPEYDAEGCSGPLYCSLIMARERRALETFWGATAAINTPDSMSGMLALKLVVAPYARNRRFFGGALLTGSHANSLEAVLEGEADICAIDAVTAALLRRHRPQLLDGLHEIGRSPQVPGLPFVTRAGDPAQIREALVDVMNDSSLADTRHALLLRGVAVLPDDAYDVIPHHERAMQSPGGVDLFS